LKQVATTNPVEAHLLAGALEREGVRAFVREQAAGVVPGGEASVWVEQDSDEERARELWDEMRSPEEGDKSASRRGGSGTALVLGMILGAIAASVYWSELAPQPDRPESWDRNQDGRTDAWASYGQAGMTTEASFDRNFDGEPDVWQEFDEGERPTTARYDNDFDGEVDFWEEYEDGVAASYSADNDRDGKPDEWGEIKGGVIEEIRWSFNNDSIIDKRAFYRNGRRLREQLDRDRDGRFDETLHYDEFERVIRTE